LADAGDDDLRAAGPRGLVIAADHCRIHSIAVHAINAHLGSLGQAVEAIPPIQADPSKPRSLRALVDALRAGEVDCSLFSKQSGL